MKIIAFSVHIIALADIPDFGRKFNKGLTFASGSTTEVDIAVGLVCCSNLQRLGANVKCAEAVPPATTQINRIRGFALIYVITEDPVSAAVYLNRNIGGVVLAGVVAWWLAVGRRNLSDD